MLVRREAIEQVGLMDEQFFMYAEETDWCYRLKKAGWKILFTPSAEIIHLHGASTKKMKSLMALQLQGSILLFLKKHNGFLVYVLACLLVAIFFIVRVPYWLGKAAFSKYDRNTHLQTARTYMIGFFRALMGGSSLCIER